MLPHEREMAKKYAGKPFTLLGVNSDQSRSALKKTMEAEKITWPNIWGDSPAKNLIARAWEVTGWPTLFVLDHEGIVRYKNLRGEQLEKAIEELIAKVPAGATTQATSQAAGAGARQEKPA